MTDVKPTMTPEELAAWEKDPTHGLDYTRQERPEHSRYGYQQKRCRCSVCVKANSDYWREWNAKRKVRQ